MTCASDNGYSERTNQSPITFAQWKRILSKLTKEEAIKQLSSNSNSHRRSTTTRQYSSPIKKSDRQSLPRNQVFSDTVVDSFLVSSSNVVPSSSSIDVPRIISSPTKRYVSSFKTLVNSTSSRHSQRLNYVNDSVIILKLSKENETENTIANSQVSSKVSTSSTTPPLKQSSPSPPRLSPILKVEGQKRRTTSNDPSLIPTNHIDQSSISNSVQTMAMSTTSHPSSNPSLFAYRSTLTGGSTVRQRALAETSTTSLLITTERLKTNINSSMRPARQPLTTTAMAAMSSVYMPAQQSQRNTSQSTRSRNQQDRLTSNSKDLYEYPDPFTNCPPDILSKLAQLTKLQLETVEWEKKRRFTRKKPLTNGPTHGKDSP